MRRSLVLTIAAVSSFLFAGAVVRLKPRFSSAEAAQPQAAQAAAPQQSPLKPVSASNTKTAQPLTPGSELYTAKPGESIPTVAHHYLSKTSYFTSSELAEAIRHANGDRTGNILKAGEQITIPGILPAPIVEKTVPVARDFEVRAIYLTGVMAASDHGLRIIRRWREVGGNAVVFDIKDSDGNVNIPFEYPLVGDHHVYMRDLPKFVHFLHSENMHAIARIAIFRDEHLVTTHPELAVQSKKNHAPWRENGKLVWTDSSNPAVQDYNIALAKFVAQSGADEIQFDYVRFPAEGDQKDASFVFQKDHGSADAASANSMSSADTNCPAGATRNNPVGATDNSPALQRQVTGKDGTKSHRDGGKAASHPTCNAENNPSPQRPDVITAFLKKAYAELHPTGALLSLDVFGVMAWQRQVDLSHTGQDIVGMAKYCDVLSPMIYPSHFFGMDKIEHPGDAPEHFIGESMERFELITHPDGNRSTGVVIRPWLQAFHWRTKTYSSEYIKVQVATAREKGGIGFLFWNAANDYSKPFVAMPEMHEADLKQGSKDQPKYFRGDELPGTSVRASLSPAN